MKETSEKFAGVIEAMGKRFDDISHQAEMNVPDLAKKQPGQSLEFSLSPSRV